MKKVLFKIIDYIRWFVKEKLHSGNPNLPFYIAIALSIILFGVTFGLFLEITENLFEDNLAPYDEAVTDAVMQFRSPALTKVFTYITHMGDRTVYLVIIVGLSIYFWLRFRNWKFTAQMTVVLMLTAISNVAIKKVINRTRPQIEHLVEVNSLSFPSGHSMSAMAFYGFLIYLCIRYKMAVWLRGTLISALVLLILLIGLSRVYLGVHYPTDVAAGFLGGLIWIAFSALVFNTIDLMRQRKKSKNAGNGIEPENT
jgi:membrane-associated phospholipid phosphatase